MKALMTTEGLGRFDPSFSLLAQREDDFQITSLCSPEEMARGGLGVASDGNFLAKLGSRRQVPREEFGLLVDKKWWESLAEEKRDHQKSICADFAFVGQVDSAAHALCLFSRAFYHQEFEGMSFEVDGRQLGTVDIHPSAQIAQHVFLGEEVSVEANVKIHSGARLMGKNHIGEGSEIFPGVTLYPKVSLGQGCRLHSGCVVGADGFSYRFLQGAHQKIWHFGGVELADQVEIGANSCIDGGTFCPTRIGRGTKLDNLVQIGHNCQVGKGVVLCGMVAVGGSAVIGDFCVFGGKAALGDNVTLGAGSQVAGACMVNASWPENSKLGGHPARPLREWLKGVAYLRKMSLRRDSRD